jgi:hypothetical protein
MQPIPEETLVAIEYHLHSVIRGQVALLIDKHAVPLPSLAAMVAGEVTKHFRPSHIATDVWFFRVPGMYGGFRLWWIDGGAAAKLRALAICRIADDNGQLYEITAEGSLMVEPGTH